MKKNKIEGRPTKDLHIDESQLNDEDLNELHTRSFPLSIVIFISILVLLCVICVVMIALVNNGVIH